MKALTERQQQVLDHMRTFLVEFDRLPTYKEIAQHFKWASPNAAVDHVMKLISAGALVRNASGHLSFARPSLSGEDHERELQIQAHGLLMQAAMSAWERTGCFEARGKADYHLGQQSILIKQRSASAVQQMELAGGLNG